MELSEIKMVETDVPATVSTRPTEPNIFDGKFPTTKALTFDLPGPKDSELARKVTNMARKAAQAVEKTARVKLDEKHTGSGKAQKTVTTLTVWTVEKITRPGAGVRKPA